MLSGVTLCAGREACYQAFERRHGKKVTARTAKTAAIRKRVRLAI